MTRPGRRLGRLLCLSVVAALTLTGCGFKGLYSAPLPGGADLGNHPYTVTARFADVLDLVPQSAVKVNDIAVGKVTAISLKGWTAQVTMSVNDSVHLPANSRAEVAQTSLLGEKYVALMGPLGTPGVGRLRNGAHIALSSTRSAPEVEEVLGALSLLLNQGGVQQIQVIARELNSALTGNESGIHDLIKQLNVFVGTLDSQKTKITGALDSVNTLAATLNRQKTVLTETLDTFPAALKVLADERGKLTTLLTSLAHLGKVATGVIDKTQTNLISSLKHLEPVLTQLTAAGSDLPRALRIIGTFPFPLGSSRQFVRGDYANLAATLNLNLSDELCGILGTAIPQLCTTAAPILGGTSSGTAATQGATGAGSSPSGSAQSGSPAVTGSGPLTLTNPPDSSQKSLSSNSAGMTPLIIGAGG